jgi:hypothetical protein
MVGLELSRGMVVLSVFYAMSWMANYFFAFDCFYKQYGIDI